ncbi:TDP-N-acetylfucosamine:lipid II N-acetylfucosaminyltransferase [Halomonas sp. 7T]|uniref:TDP-N-acetylfucosamine:lipid II N-acetylfucosaminyltransferase n=1 Tax=Halomonas sp. 7T TaxID=2893469 RepID=UPI0021D93D9E|nr:TDP-N-acetylfucosamine:lipid II N-acetylfucosaminyltransferase [Halomonas sp. 7T]UXZ54259.1 TDP-N-acetylfucosamine:lipid II N-acetylfucosaminyltransferase [Halomonas sp. 7T]
MAKKTPASAAQKRKPRILWANAFCLLDTSSGASMTVRQMLKQLVKAGYEVEILGATVFDHPQGAQLFQSMALTLQADGHMVEVEDGSLTHQLIVSKSTYRANISATVEDNWHRQYIYLLDSFKPDIVWFYGGQPLELLIADEARARDIPTAFYLANGNYKSPRWCRDVDLVLCDSQATARMYRETVGFVATPLGKFIDSQQFVAEHHQPKRLLFVNPSFEKGASIVVQLALQLEHTRPDIEIEVVEARADWQQVLNTVTRQLGEERSSLPNVFVTPNTSDMREPYSRTRVLLAPSLWWESSGRVLAEAMLNGIPAIITNRGGMPEMIDDAGIKLDFPEACYEQPYQHLLSNEELTPLVEAVTAFYDDEAHYQTYAERAARVGREKHHLSVSTKRLTQALAPLVAQKAGNKDFLVPQRKQHKHRLAGTAAKPKFSSEAYVAPPQAVQQKVIAPAAPKPTLDFDWQLSSKVVVLDNRAKLIQTGAADKLITTNAFTVLAFDPASEVANASAYEGHEHIQLFQHALLGDGQPAELNACLEATLTSTLTLLPESALPEHRRQGAKVLTQLPINTIALDSIEGLPSLDWLILDDLSDASAILANGEKALKDTLLIQARVAFQPTHEKQPNLAELQHWATRNGFRFYRFNDIQHHSHIPSTLKTHERPATEQESADVLFLPSQERMAALSEEQKLKLAFVLSTVFEAKDMAYELLNEVDEKQALKYLLATGVVTPPDRKVEISGNENVGPLDPQDLEGVNLHVMVTEKFIAPYIDFISEHIPKAKNHYVITGEQSFSYGLTNKHGIEFINSIEGFSRLEDYMLYAEKVIFHGLWSENAYSILNKKAELYSKSYWIPWGGDFYFPERHSKIKKEVIKNIGNIVSFVEPDVEYIRKRYGAKGCHHKALTYPVSLFSELYATPYKKEDNINVIVGNSAFETNNHFDVFKKIEKIASQPVNVYVPLSYGPYDYAKTVTDFGYKIFNENFFPITHFMDRKEYEEFLYSIDLAFYGYDRQQALGNINLLLSMGKKIYMKKDSPNWNHYKALGFRIYDIDLFSYKDIFNIDFEENNVSLARKCFSSDEFKRNWQDILL